MSARSATTFIEQPHRNRIFCAPNDDSALGTLVCIKAKHHSVGHSYKSSAGALCFVRGTGKIAINGRLVDYSGKWFDIPHEMEYEIIPETDTVILAIQKPIEEFSDVNKLVFGESSYDARSIS
jgi:hypothetical protein